VTISTTTTRNDYTGNGVTADFAFTFKAMADDWVKVFVDSVEQLSGFSVARNPDQDSSPGGVVTFVTAPSVLPVRVQRAVPLTQEVALSAYSPFPAKTVERAIDATVMQAQQLDAVDQDLGAADLALSDRIDAQDAQIAAIALGSPADAGAALVTATGRDIQRTLADHLATLPDALITAPGISGASFPDSLSGRFWDIDAAAKAASLITFDGSSILEAKGLVYTQNGTVPQVSAAGMQCPRIGGGAGPFSDANYYGPINGANADVLDTTGDRWGVAVFQTPTTVGIMLCNGPYLASAGWGIARQPTYMQFASWAGSGKVVNTPNDCAAGFNILCWWRTGTTMKVKMNRGTTGTNASAGTEVAGSSYPMRIGRYETAGFPFLGYLMFAMMGNGKPPGGDGEAWATAQMQRFMKRTILCLGDSIVFGSNSTRPFPNTLGLNLGFPVLNYGVAGLTTTQVLTQWTTGTLSAIPSDTVVVLCGINDCIAGTTEATIQSNLSTIYSQAAGAGAKVIAVTMLPWKGSVNYTAGRETTRLNINAWIRAQAAANGYSLVEAATAFDDGAGKLIGTYDSGDHLHPNAAGSDLLASLVLAAGP
jgi:lysophospholipase L1-like esterase